MVSGYLLLTMSLDSAFGTEVDSFTTRSEALEDATPVLDDEMNRRLGEAIDNANRRHGCNDNALAFHIGDQLRAGLFGAFMISPLEYYANRSEEVDGRRSHRRDSIYREVGFFESAPITMYPLGELISVNGHFISGDKFSHFLNVGWSYYRRVYRSGQSVEEALRWGQETERGIWGLAVTGVYSNADLVANFDGMRFWTTILGGEDPLEGTLEPLIECVDGHWAMTRPFSWSNWVNAGWDEAMNCNEYAPRMTHSVSLGMVHPDGGTDYRCPMDPEVCVSLSTEYGMYAEFLISSECQ